MKKKCLAERTRALRAEIMRANWGDTERRSFVLQFFRLVELLASVTRSSAAPQALHLLSWSLCQLINNPEGSFGGSRFDTELTNEFARRALQEFGVLESVAADFPLIEGQWNRYFNPRDWAGFWDWARADFFELDDVPSLAT